MLLERILLAEIVGLCILNCMNLCGMLREISLTCFNSQCVRSHSATDRALRGHQILNPVLQANHHALYDNVGVNGALLLPLQIKANLLQFLIMILDTCTEQWPDLLYFSRWRISSFFQFLTYCGLPRGVCSDRGVHLRDTAPLRLCPFLGEANGTPRLTDPRGRTRFAIVAGRRME